MALPTPTTISARAISSPTCARRTGRSTEGVDLRGYMHWSLLDNFEWSEGFTKRFGLAEVDLATQRRTLRASAQRVQRDRAVELGHPPRYSTQLKERVTARFQSW